MRRVTLKFKNSRRGQSFIELLLVTLILALLLSGAAEFGFLINNYLHVLDAAREAARFSSMNEPFMLEQINGVLTYNPAHMQPGFYFSTTERVGVVLDPVVLDPVHGDDVVISVFSNAGSTAAIPITRYPLDDQQGWSLCANYDGFVAYLSSQTPPMDTPSSLLGLDPVNKPDDWKHCIAHPSHFTSAQILSFTYSNAPSTGIVLVEVFYSYQQILKMPIFVNSLWSVVPDPISVYAYTIMPISAAEPTATQPNP